MAKYDYVVVGAGSAGCVVASRLSEGGEASVLLIEAGPQDTDPNIWGLSTQLKVWNTERDWAYKTVPQRGTAGTIHDWPRGRTLGGSSAINGMIYVRGDRTDYDSWAYQGCVGWDYDSVLPYFMKSENFSEGAGPFHGAGGPLNVTVNRDPNPLAVAAVESSIALGHANNADYNGAATLGASYIQMTTKDGRRHTTAAAFIHPLNRANLTVVTEAHVQRLTFEGDRCTGLEYMREGQVVRAEAAIEVIVSGGTIGSAQLLMLSGIGDAEELRAVGIKPLIDLRGVGKNLHDHMMCAVNYEAKRPIPSRDENFMQAQLFAKTDSRRVGPDIQPIFATQPFYMNGLEGPSNGYTLLAGTLRNNSLGSIKLASSNPSDKPLIDPAYLATDYDRHILETAVEICREIGQQKPFDEWRLREVFPGPKINDKASLRAFVERSCFTYYHPVGTCKMGTGQDSVVDPELRVRGTRGLRVADASIMPTIPSGNTNAPSIMIGEKVSDMIKQAAGVSIKPINVVAA